MATISDILNSEIQGIPVEKLGLFFLILFSTFIIRSLFIYILEKKITFITKRTKSDIDDLIVATIKTPLSYFILLQGLYIGLLSLQLPDQIGFVKIGLLINNGYILAVSFILLYMVFKLIDVVGYVIHKVAASSDSKLDDQLAPLLVKTLRIFVLVLGVLFIVRNFGYDITSLLAGLGIGGLAFALAAQDTVSNLFGSFTVLSDRPFRIGDWIEVGDFEGTVEEIGFRSTRIRRFDQALVTLPNSQFIKNGVINYSARPKRRIKFTLGVTYGTTAAQMTQVVEGIKQIINDDPRFDHNFYMVRFTDFGAYSLDIFIYCFTRTIVWDEHLQIKEDFNLKIMYLLEELGVEVAFPSQTVFLDKSQET
jgi:MscS family membrane protein